MCQIESCYFLLETNYIITLHAIIGIGTALLVNVSLNLLLKSLIMGCYGKYFIVISTSISICSSSSLLLVSTQFIFLESFCNNLAFSVFYTMLFPSNRIWPLESSDKLSQVFSVLCRPFYEHKNAVLPEHQIVLFFKYICLKN